MLPFNPPKAQFGRRGWTGGTSEGKLRADNELGRSVVGGTAGHEGDEVKPDRQECLSY